MLDISLLELMGRAQKKVLAHEPRLGMDERHHVLQLVAEAECAPGLVVSGPRPQAACKGLVDKPAVGQRVDGLVGRFHLHSAEGVVPILPDLFKRPAAGNGTPEAAHQVACVIGVSSYAEPEDDLPLLPVSEIEGNLDSGAGVKAGPDPAGKPGTGHRSRPLMRAVAAEELGPVAGNGPGRLARIKERGPVGELRVIRVPREDRAGFRVDLGDHLHCRFWPQISQHPFHVTGGREPARTA